MKISVQSTKAVKPAYAGGVAPGTTADAIPLTVLDKANFDTYISVIYAFRPSAGAGQRGARGRARQGPGRVPRVGHGNRAIMLSSPTRARGSWRRQPTSRSTA
ncbi:hypothetical protein EJB05_18015, partial [Eragrostis curvula]